MGIAQLPGGDAVFPALSIAENIEAAKWIRLADDERPVMELDDLLSLFPDLRRRWDEPAANLSGGQQQMLALAMVLVGAPRVLMIDELSLGLAPAVVEQLLPVIEKVAAAGVTVILVEQVGEPGSHHCRSRVLHGEGSDPVQRTHCRIARSARHLAVGVSHDRNGG